MRTYVTFRSGRFDTFPADDALDDPLVPFGAPPGRDLAEWLRSGLEPVHDLAVYSPVQEEWGWGLRLQSGEQACTVHAGLLSEVGPAWLVVARPVVSVRPRGSGRVDQHALERVIEALHELLTRGPEIHDLGWHEADAFDRGVVNPSPSPFTPSPPERA
jgi:hypothetical protein